MNEMIIDSTQTLDESARANRPNGLYETNLNLRQRGAGVCFVLEESLYQRAKINPLATAGVLIGGSVALAAWLNTRKNQRVEHF